MFELNVELLEKGGVLMYPIFLLSVIALAVFFERLFSLRESNFVPRDFMERLMEKLNNKDIEAAKTMCAENRSSISSCFVGQKPGLAQKNWPSSFQIATGS